MGWLSDIGHTVGGLAKKAAPIVGMVPGVGSVAAGALGGLGGLLEEGGGLKSGLQGAAMGAAGGLVNKIPGAQDFLGKVGSTLGGSIKDTFMPNGKLDLGKVAGAGGAVMNLIGQNRQRSSAENYNNSQIDQRNQLMSNIMGPSNFNLPDISDNVNRAARPVGPNITPMNPNAMASKKLTSGSSPNLNQQASAS